MIPYGLHNVDNDDINAVIKVLQSGQLTCGPVVEKFEEALCKKLNSSYVVACSNGTTALHLALLSLELGPKDVVLVPAITFLASANAVRYVGGDVAFVDVDPNTGLMTASTLESAILKHKGKNLKAVINVHLAGQCEDLESIYDVCKKNNLWIIEDASHAIGTLYIDKNGNSHAIGSNAFSDITTFSFHPVKTIAMGEGGAVTTNDTKIAKTLRLLRSHGMIRSPAEWENQEQGIEKDSVNPWYYEMHELGYNYRVSDINCALGLNQLNKLDQFANDREIKVKLYDALFENLPNFRPLEKLKHSKTAWHLYILRINFKNLNKTRSEIMKFLVSKNIGSQVHYIPVYRQPYYEKEYGLIRLEGAEAYYNACLSIPLYASLEEEQQQYIYNQFCLI